MSEGKVSCRDFLRASMAADTAAAISAMPAGNPPDVMVAAWLHKLLRIASQGALTGLKG
ncbi:MAG: hypothetical protein OXI34_02740 [Chloroflexota bacterium]|nr:hypothetical protein [Chloroflexota bacterium]MDE2946138.1 hypothetical protein [Chloroflexota bacterium]